MGMLPQSVIIILITLNAVLICKSAKINTPRVLLPWFQNLNVNFTFEIIEGGCQTWSLSRDDIIDLEPIYEDVWGHCSRAARVSVSKTCVPPGSVIIIAEDMNTGEIVRGDVDIDKISSLKVMSTTSKLYLEEAPEAFEVIAYDDTGNRFSTLEGVSFTWTIENIGTSYGEDPLVQFVKWCETSYEAPHGVAELEAQGRQSHSVLLYGQAIGESRVTVCLESICAECDLQVVASVVLTPTVAYIAPGDTLRYKVVRVRAGRLAIQDVTETLYNIKVPKAGVANLEDAISLVRGVELGASSIELMSGIMEVAKATLHVVEPFSIRVTIRPATLLTCGHEFVIHCVVFDEEGHPLTAGQDMLIRLTVEGVANVDLLRSTENGTLTDAVAQNSGEFTITARLYSIAGRMLLKKVEGQASATAIDPLQVVPPELFIAWTEKRQDVALKHIGGGTEVVTWSESETGSGSYSLSPGGVLSIRGVVELGVRVHLTNYPYIWATGRVRSAVPELVQVSSSGFARVGRPHHLHIALTATHPTTGELYNFHTCNCDSFAVSLLEGPEPHNITAAPWIEPVDGACCVLQCTFIARGVSTVHVSLGRARDTARIAVRAAPSLLWPKQAAALVGATLPVLAEGESLSPLSSESRITDVSARGGDPPHKYPDVQLFTMKCRRKGDARLELQSFTDEESESVDFEASCAPFVSRIRLEPPDTPGNCSGGSRIWLRPGQEVSLKVTLLDAIGRELLDEEGPTVAWELQPKHVGIEFKSADRLFVENNPEYAPVAVPNHYYQLVEASEQAIGWTGALKASIPDATANIQAKVVAPLKCEPLKVNVAWEGETIPNIAKISGGSGQYTVDTPKGVTSNVDGNILTTIVPSPGTYELIVSDLCVTGETQVVEVNIEEVLSVEVSTARAVCVGSCVPISALVKGISHKYLATSREPEWKTTGQVFMENGNLCGLKEGTGRVKASLSGVWSPEVEVTVFPALRIIPERSRIPVGGRVQLRHVGGPPSHLATLNYQALSGLEYLQVSQAGLVHGQNAGKARVKLIASDIANVELASAEAEIEVITISNIRVVAATQTLLVGSPGWVRISAGGLSCAALASLQPAPRVTWLLRDATKARLYHGHADDLLERSVVEGLAIRVVPLKPGVITLDVRIRNMGQTPETRTWDSTIEILGISDIHVSVEGLSNKVVSSNRLSLAVGGNVRLKSLPRGVWSSLYDDGAFELSNADVKAMRPGHGVVLVKHKDEKNSIERKSMIHVEVSTPHYCTAEPSGDTEESAIRLVLRDGVGRELLAPQANVTLIDMRPLSVRRAIDSALGNELVISGLDTTGVFLTFQSSLGLTTVTDEVWVTGSDTTSNRIIATGSWAICLEGVGWVAPPAVSLHPASGVTLAVLTSDASGRHVLRLDRPSTVTTVHQVPVQKMAFLPGDWPYTLVPISIEGEGLSSSPLLCSEEQKFALEGVEVELPFTCRTKALHLAKPVLDIMNGQLGCSIVPGIQIVDSSEVELCAEWGVIRTCTKVLLLPPIVVSQKTISLLNPPATFTITGHPRSLKMIKMIPSPGLKLEVTTSDNEINVIVKSETVICGMGWVNVLSKLTAQDIRVEVERDYEIACGTVLGAIFSLLLPYLPTLLTIAAIGIVYSYAQTRHRTGQINLPNSPTQTVLPETPPLRTRTWSRSPYATSGPSSPVYGDTSMLPDASFSPNSMRMHPRFL